MKILILGSFLLFTFLSSAVDNSALAQGLKATTQSEAELKQWFADLVWRKFVEERDPRLNDEPVSFEELDAFVAEAERDRAGIRLSLEDFTRLLKYREQLCESNAPFGVDLKRGYQFE